ncbi:MAG: DUF4230 domain-containing protein [Halanaerobiales bacterium]
MKKNNYFLIIVLIIAVVIQGIWIYSLNNSEPDSQITYSSVLESVQSIGELNTLEMYFHDIVEYTENKKFRNIIIPLTTKSFIFTVEARVKAGVDLNKLDPNNFTIEENRIELTMPEYEVTSVEFIDYNPYSENDALFNRIKNDDLFGALENFSDEITVKAVDIGIIEKAKASGETFMYNFLSNLGFEEIIIN